MTKAEKRVNDTKEFLRISSTQKYVTTKTGKFRVLMSLPKKYLVEAKNTEQIWIDKTEVIDSEVTDD